jgi:hypothetical protein
MLVVAGPEADAGGLRTWRWSRRSIAAAVAAAMKVEVSTEGLLRRLGPWPTPSAATTRAPTS